MYAIARLEGQLSNYPEQLNLAIFEFRRVLRMEHQDLNSRYKCVDWTVVILFVIEPLHSSSLFEPITQPW